MRTRRVAALLLFTVAVTAFGPSSAAHAQTRYVWYSVGQENWAAGNQTGVSVQRYDINIDAGGQCSNPDSPTRVIQDEWVNIDSLDWMELGTSHETASCKYWFWGYYAPDGKGFREFGDIQIGYGQHTFKIVRGPTGGTWQFIIDTSPMAEYPIFVNNVGSYLQAGLESYNSSATVATHGYYSLQYNQGGPWYSWVKPETQGHDPPACGQWTNLTHWTAWENSSCTS
jgi:hypothetical protein